VARSPHQKLPFPQTAEYKLYEMGRISGGFGAQILGCDRWEFYRLLSENGFAVIDYPDDELDREGTVEEIWYKQAQES
jgi:hypothetical protein